MMKALLKRVQTMFVQCWKIFFDKLLRSTVRHLVICCDSCASQNKNYTVMSLLHTVFNKNRFDSVKVVFPIRGHSYMEGDKGMSLVNAKAYTETPKDWRDVLRTSRIKPTPFTVINCATDVNFQTWTDFLTEKYVKKCPMPTRPIFLRA